VEQVFITLDLTKSLRESHFRFCGATRGHVLLPQQQKLTQALARA